jgi:D-alanyl-D-alanine carboxypeptidase/D-alanyl-D-alanine-endopeptidase (penicillin-binding protein 4)
MKTKLKILCWIIFFLFAYRLEAQKSSNKVEMILQTWANDSIFTHASWGFKAINLSSNEVIAEYSSQKSLIPASVMKVVTVGTGFLVKQPDATFETCLQYNGVITQDSLLQGDIVICGKGDPTLGSARFKEQLPATIFPLWANAIRSLGIKTIDGKIITKNEFMTDEPFPDGWTWGDIGNYYGAGIYGLNFLDNEFKVFFAPAEKKGDTAIIIRVEPAMPNVHFTSFVTIAEPGSGDNTIVYQTFDENHYHIRGTIPLQKKEFSIRCALSNPADILIRQFSDYLTTNGFTVNSKDFSQNNFDRIPVLFYTHHPIRYHQIARLTMQNSVNLYAEAILHSFQPEKSHKENILFVNELIGNKGVSVAGCRMMDGSGLSRNNALSASFLCDFLKMMFATPMFSDFYAVFPVAGVSGTLSGICKNTTAQNNLRAKSGSMEGVRSYAGYVHDSHGNMICFALIINNFEGKKSVLTSKIESLFVALAER